MVLENNKALLYISSTGFQLYGDDGVASIHFNYPEGTVENASVKDGEKLKSEVLQLIEGESPKNKKGGEIAVVLAEDTIRQDLIDTITKVFENAGWKAEMRSLPLAAEEVTASKTLTPDLVRAILSGRGDTMASRDDKDAGVMKVEESAEEAQEASSTPDTTDVEKPQPQHNLLDEVAQEASRDGSGNMKKILIIVVLLLVGAGLIFAGLKYGGKFLGSNNETEEELSEEFVEEVATPTPTPEVSIEKSEVTVKVLNGTGTPGQAGTAKTVLEDLGFEGVTAGNAPTKDAASTTVVFSSDIPKSVRDEVVEALDEVFDSVEQEEDEDAKMTITVTTGPEQEEEEETTEDSE